MRTMRRLSRRKVAARGTDQAATIRTSCRFHAIHDLRHMHFSSSFSLPSEILDSEQYDDSDGVLRAIEQHASSTSTWRMRGLAERISVKFPLLAGATVGYVELSDSIIDSLNISAKDAKWAKAALVSHPCSVASSVPPTLFVNLDIFESANEADRDVWLTHEAVHLEQVVRGTWRSVGVSQWWEGKLWDGDIGDINEGIHKGDLDATVKYLQLPWEKEAIIRSEGEGMYLQHLQFAWCRSIADRHGTGPLLTEDVVDLMRALLLDAATQEDMPAEGVNAGDAAAIKATWAEMGFPMTDGQAVRLGLIFEKVVPGWHLADSLSPSALRQALCRTVATLLASRQTGERQV